MRRLPLLAALLFALLAGPAPAGLVESPAAVLASHAAVASPPLGVRPDLLSLAMRGGSSIPTLDRAQAGWVESSDRLSRPVGQWTVSDGPGAGHTGAARKANQGRAPPVPLLPL